jgi:hypothetical protein
MSIKVKEDLKYLAATMPARATYSDAMYELYVRMKVAQGSRDATAGRTLSHDTVRRRFAK